MYALLWIDPCAMCVQLGSRVYATLLLGQACRAHRQIKDRATTTEDWQPYAVSDIAGKNRCVAMTLTINLHSARP